MKMLKFQKLPDSRRNHYVAASLLLLGISLEISTLSKLVVAVDIAVEEVAYSDSPSTTDEKGMTINDIGNGEDKQDETNSAAASKSESIIEEGEENNIHLMPSSIATATLVGARLRESADIIAAQDPSHRRINNDNKHHNSNNIVNSNINDIGMNFLHWAELPTPMKEAASTLGCTSQMWDNHEESPQCELFWSELTPEDQRAAMVLRYQSSSWGSDDDDDDDVDDNEDVSASVDIIEDERNPNPNHVTDRCHWGAMGCNKGGTSWNSNAGSTAASSKINSTPEGGVDGDDGDIIGLHQSSLAGSATAKIEAHVMKGAIQSTLSSKKDGFQSKGGLDLTPTNPPQGFLLAARIVTSPHDGLSYFLDVPEANIKMMMTIPYTFVECGRNIESSTESFPLEDMVVRHLPAGADIGHWVNLGGGVTVDPDEEDDKGSSPRYINGNHDGRPKLLVALSPIEILVSGNEEESRTFNPGEIILMEDTLGKGHKMRANSRGKDLSVIMISLPHTVHYPAAVVDWSSMTEEEQTESSTFDSHVDGAHQSLFGFAQKHRRSRSKARHTTKPCPLEYDSAYSSLFTPTSHIKMRQKRRRRMKRIHLKSHSFAAATDSSDDFNYPPPPGYSTYKEDDKTSIFEYLPSLRRSILVGIGLSVTSSFVYCAQLLYPPFLALWGGATLIVLGAVVNVIGVRWLYQENWMVVWEEERRWKREVKRQKKRRGEQQAASTKESTVEDSQKL